MITDFEVEVCGPPERSGNVGSPSGNFHNNKKYRKLVLVAASGLLAVGCVTPKRSAGFVVPAQCMRISADSFTRPCAQRADGKLICDGVLVTATCVRTSSR